MNTSTHTPHRLWWLAWVAAFLGYPPGGLLATAIINYLDTPIEGLVGGFLAGVVIGAAQYLALRLLIPVRPLWIGATSAGLAVGVALSVALFGSDTALGAILLRALVTGMVLGLAQSLAFRGLVRNAWVVAQVLFHPLAWYITAQVIGQNIEAGFVIFGASGALFYQAALGGVLARIKR